MYTNFLQPSILEPTRIVANNRRSPVHNIFINTLRKEISSGNLVDKISDHMLNFVIVKYILEKKRNKIVKIRDMKKSCKETFLKDLDEIKSIDLLKHNSVDEILN